MSDPWFYIHKIEKAWERENLMFYHLYLQKRIGGEIVHKITFSKHVWNGISEYMLLNPVSDPDKAGYNFKKKDALLDTYWYTLTGFNWLTEDYFLKLTTFPTGLEDLPQTIIMKKQSYSILDVPLLQELEEFQTTPEDVQGPSSDALGLRL